MTLESHLGHTRNAYRISVGKSEGKRSLARSVSRWEENITNKMGLKEYYTNMWAAFF
jgi:hypothetical protein